MRVLFSKTDALGDQLWATGTVAAILERMPAASVVWFVREGYEALHSLLPGAAVFRADQKQPAKNEARRLLGSPPSPANNLPWARVVFVPISLNAYAHHPAGRDLLGDTGWWIDFTHALHVDHAIAGTVTLNWVDQTLCFATAAKQRIGHAESPNSQPLPEGIKELLKSRQLPVGFTHTVKPAASGHEGDNLACLAEPLTGQPGGADIRLHFNPGNDRRSKSSGPIILAPGAGDFRRIYPLKNLAKAVQKIAAERKTASNIVIFQGPQDVALCRNLREELQSSGLKIRLVEIDPNNLREAADLMLGAGLFICNESFWAHLACALGTPTVAIWGLGHWGRFTPRQGRVTVLHTEMLCQNCDWHCCFAERHCVTDIPPQAVVEAARGRLLDPNPGLGVAMHAVPSPLAPAKVRAALRAQSAQAAVATRELKSLQKEVADLKVMAREAARLRSDAEKQRDDAKTEAKESERIRKSVEKVLRDAEKQRDDAKAEAKESERIRKSVEKVLRDAEKQRDDATAWAKDEQKQRLVIEKILRDAEKQRDDTKTEAKESERIRKSVEKVLRDAEKQRDDATAWAKDEQKQRLVIEKILRDAEKQRDDARAVTAEIERQKNALERVLRDAEKQRDDRTAWAEEERKQRLTFESLLRDAEKQRNDVTAWAEQERAVRNELQAKLEQVLKNQAPPASP